MHLEGRESWAKKIPSYPTSTMIFKLMNMYIMSLGNVFSSVYFMMWVQVRIFARKPAIAAGQGDYALNITGPILKFFEKYYSSKYPLPKSGKSTTRIWFKDKYRPTFANCPESSSGGIPSVFISIIYVKLKCIWKALAGLHLLATYSCHNSASPEFLQWRWRVQS